MPPTRSSRRVTTNTTTNNKPTSITKIQLRNGKTRSIPKWMTLHHLPEYGITTTSDTAGTSSNTTTSSKSKKKNAVATTLSTSTSSSSAAAPISALSLQSRTQKEMAIHSLDPPKSTRYMRM
eukprot:g5087.t1 g5087   contig18:611120-611485(+)